MNWMDPDWAYEVIAKYAPATGLSVTEIAAFRTRGRARAVRDTLILLQQGRIKNAGTAATPRYVATAVKPPCPTCGRT